MSSFSVSEHVLLCKIILFKNHNSPPFWLFPARVVTDRVSGYSKGFGFVRYATVEEAAKGIEGMDGKVSRMTGQ